MRVKSEKWDRFYLSLAQFVSQLSKDSSTKVGAVVVNWEHGLEFVGYNGFPPGVNDDPERYNNRELKYQLVDHAERNAIRKANKAGNFAKGATLYVWPAFSFPPMCNECAKEAIGSGIKEVVGYKLKLDTKEQIERHNRWEGLIAISRLMAEEAGVTWREIEP